MNIIKIKLKGGVMPTKGTPGSAAWDLYTPIDGVIYPGARQLIPLGFYMELEYCAAILTHRSGLNKYGIMAYGLVDPDYRGEVMMVLHNTGNKPFWYKEGDRVGQMRLVDVPQATLVEADELNRTERGEGGYGSTGS